MTDCDLIKKALIISKIGFVEDVDNAQCRYCITWHGEVQTHPVATHLYTDELGDGVGIHWYFNSFGELIWSDYGPRVGIIDEVLLNKLKNSK